jgi:hypothetical protein
MLVLTGVTSAADLITASRRRRPRYVADDLSGLNSDHPTPEQTADGVTCRGWRVIWSGQSLLLSGRQAQTGDHLDALRALCVAGWHSGAHRVSTDDEPAKTVVDRLGL